MGTARRGLLTDPAPVAVEFFCGTKSYAKACDRAGIECLTLDLDRRHKPDICADILEIEVEDLPERFRHPTYLWASVPCTNYSVLMIGQNWRVTKEGWQLPRNRSTEGAMVILAKTLMLIKEMRPLYFFIENPRDKMRSLPFMQPWYLSMFFGEVVKRKTVTYCQYGDRAQKPTDIWTNCLGWKPRPACSPGSPCHQPAPRGSTTGGTQGKSCAKTKAIVPAPLCDEIVAACLGPKTSRDAYVF